MVVEEVQGTYDWHPYFAIYCPSGCSYLWPFDCLRSLPSAYSGVD